MKARWSIAAAALVAATVITASVPAAADRVWANARDSQAYERELELAKADALITKYRAIARTGEEPGARLARPFYLRDARKILEGLGAERSPDIRIRLRYAGLLSALDEPDRATKVLESIVKMDLPAPLREEAWSELSVCYAKLGRQEDEIKAHAKALALEPHGRARSTMLANRAEAYMGLGRIEEAVAGYREALRELLPIEMYFSGVTTLWGLGVALDRSGDLEGALEAIKLGRTYDPADKQLHGPGWFYAVPHDEAWFEALGHWMTARSSDLGSVRAFSYARAIEAWEEYIARAPANDRYLPVARARLDACQKERDKALRDASRP